MILVFTPAYFDKKHTYCAREYKAMKELEKERLDYLKEKGLSDLGLIIPIIFRGRDYLPEEIKEKRQCYYFDSYMLFSEDLCMHPEYAEKIRAIADLIFKISRRLEEFPEAIRNCEDFDLPSEDEIRGWLNGLVATKMPFPGGCA